MLGLIFRHPIISGAVALIVIYVVWRSMSEPSAPVPQVYTSAGADPNVVAAGAAIQQAQMAAASEERQLQAAIEMRNLEIGGQVAIAQLGQMLGLEQTASERAISLGKIEAERTLGLESLVADVERSRMATESANLASTLAAQVQQAGITATTQQAALREATAQQQISALTSITQAEQATTRQMIASQAQVQSQQIAASQAVQTQQIKASQPKTLLGKAASFLFGGWF